MLEEMVSGGESGVPSVSCRQGAQPVDRTDSLLYCCVAQSEEAVCAIDEIGRAHV